MGTRPALKQQQTGALYRAVFDAMVDALICIDVDGVICEVNPATVRMFGYPRRDLVGRNVSMLMTEADSRDHDAYIKRYRQTNIPHVIGIGREIRAKRKNGTVFPAELTIGEIEDGAGFVGIIRNVSIRKRIETQLNNTEQRAERATESARVSEHKASQTTRQLRLLIDALPALVSYVNASGRYEFVNKQYVDWFGLSKGEIVGHSLDEVLGDKAMQRIRPRMERVLAGEAVSYEDEMTYKHGGTRFIHASYVPDITSDGTVAGFYALVNDISGRKQMELKLRAAEKMAAIGHLAAGLSHDMSNIIFALSGAAHSLRGTCPPETATTPLQHIEACVQELHKLVKGVRQLAMSGTRIAQPAIIDLAAWWDRTRPLLEVSLPRQIELHGQCEGPPLRVRVKESELTRSVLNLVVNAVDAITATSRPGIVAVSIRRNQRAGKIELAVRDDGPGIPAELVEKIFEPFFTTKSGEHSTGLGMSIIRGFVESCGGSLAVESNREGGATITLILPEAPPAPPPVPSSTHK